VRDFEQVSVFSPTAENRTSFAREFDDRLEADVRAVDSAAAAVSGADVVITATDATEPVFADADLDEGAHVTVMGQYSPDAREVEAATVARATYVPDLRARAEQDAGAYLQAREEGAIGDDHIHAELGEVVAGEAPGRTDGSEVTVFDSGGTGIETVAAAAMLYERAREDGVGSTIEITPASEAF
jgi:alanine dehydrogenase